MNRFGTREPGGMIYKTLHWYIFRELLRLFLLTSAALTTLLAFGGTFRPVTRQGIEIGQLLVLVVNLMPAMLAYAIPIAALFAAVLVYWRLSTDNELTACRAGGISFLTIVMPAFVLGLLVAVIDLGFVNVVVPQFLQKTESIVMRDMGSLIKSQIGRQEIFRWDKIAVYADSAELEDSNDPNTEVVVLNGMAASAIDPNKPSGIVVARRAVLTITNLPGQDSAGITIDLEDASLFDSNSFRRVTGSVRLHQPDGQPFVIPSLLKSKAKFLNYWQLVHLKKDPTSFPPVAEVMDKLAAAYQYRVIAGRLHDLWTARTTAGQPFTLAINSAAGPAQLDISAAHATLDTRKSADRMLTLTGNPLRIEQRVQGRLQSTFTCDSAEMLLFTDEFSGGAINATLHLQGKVQGRNAGPASAPVNKDEVFLSGIILPPAVRNVEPLAGPALLDWAAAGGSTVPGVTGLLAEGARRMGSLFQNITSELNSRGSFSVSCLTLVLLGAALGILLRGQNPLAVFVVGFVPAVVLVLLITAGRELTEGDPRTVPTGIFLIWAGNLVLLGLVAAVYAKLLRK